MTMAVLSHLSSETVDIFLSDSVVYRPDLRRRNQAFVLRELERVKPDAVMLANDDGDLVRVIRCAHAQIRIIVFGTTSDTPNFDPSLGGISFVRSSTRQGAEKEAFSEFERLARPRPEVRRSIASADGGMVTLVGAGVVNLVIALKLVREGYRVQVIDRMIDPRGCDSFPSHAVGATFGGMDARVFSFNEARHHLFRGGAYNDRTNMQFRSRISDGGWLSRDLSDLEAADSDWIERLEGIPPWVAGRYNNDIIGFNKDSQEKWKLLFSEFPGVLRGANFINRLLRIYPSESTFAAAKKVEGEIGALREELDIETLVARERSLAEAVRGGHIAGALQVEGFSLNVKTFSRNIIRLLADKGVSFLWETELWGFLQDGDGRVSGLRTSLGRIYSDHVVVCPGAYASLSDAVASPYRDVAAVMGMWITLPNEVNPLASPLKIRRKGFAADEAAEGANIVPGHDAEGRPVIYCSSGHGYVGTKPADAANSDFDELAKCVRETANELFPEKFREAERRGMLDRPPEYCIRPWTSSGLGLFEAREMTNDGTLVLVGGHNTGGFAQAPAVAEAVHHALRRSHHSMSELYHPARAHALTRTFQSERCQ